MSDDDGAECPTTTVCPSDDASREPRARGQRMTTTVHEDDDDDAVTRRRRRVSHIIAHHRQVDRAKRRHMVFTVTIVFFSRSARLVTAANVIAEGARAVEGCQCNVFRVRDVIRDEEDVRTYDRGILDCPVVTLDDIAQSDAIIFGAPTRYGRLAPELSAFFDKLSTFHEEGCALKGKIGSAFTEVGGPGHGYGGHEATLVTIHALFLQHGMVTVGVPPLPPLEATPNASVFGTALRSTVKSGAPLDFESNSIASRVRELNEAEVKIAYAQGEWVSLIAKQLHDDGAIA